MSALAISTYRSRRPDKIAPLLLLALPLLNLSCASPKQPGETTLNELAECQREYCDKLREALAAPIQWRLVLDTSGSYAGNAEQTRHMTEELVAILEELPLEEEDQVAIDAFDATYRSSTSQSTDLTACYFPDPASDLAGSKALVVERCLGKLVPNLRRGDCSSAAPPSACFTDFVQAVAAMKIKQFSRLPAPHRVFFVVLTDGQNEPSRLPGSWLTTSHDACSARHYSLFGPGTAFQTALSNFHSITTGEPLLVLNRGLVFVLTPRPQGTQCTKIPEAIEADWEKYSQFRRNAPKERSLPSVIRHNPGGTYNLKPVLEAIANRSPGATPCLSLERQANRNNNPLILSDRCLLIMTSPRVKIRLTPSELLDTSSGLNLKFFAAIRGESLGKLSAEQTELIAPLKIALSTRFDPHAANNKGWRIAELEGTLPVTQAKLTAALNGLATQLWVRGSDTLPSSLSLIFLAPTMHGFLSSVIQPYARGWMALATLCLLFGMRCSFQYFKAMQSQLVVLKSGLSEHTASPTAPLRHYPTERLKPMGLRYRVRPDGLEIQPCAWSPGGLDEGDGKCKQCSSAIGFHIDLHMLSAQPYFVCWKGESHQPTLSGGENTFCQTVPFSIVSPAGIWLPKAQATIGSSRTYLWSASPRVELDNQNPDLTLDLILHRDKRQERLRRLTVLLLVAAGFFTLVAVTSLFPVIGITSGWRFVIASGTILPPLFFSFFGNMTAAREDHLSRRRSAAMISQTRSHLAHLFSAVFLASLVASISGLTFGSWAIYVALFWLCTISAYGYFSLMPMRRLEQGKPLREADFWLDSTFWLWGRVNI